MATDGAPVETTVTDRWMVAIPAVLRRRLDIDSGDKLRWDVDEGGELCVEVLHQREGVFDDYEPVDGGEMDAVAVEREFGGE